MTRLSRSGGQRAKLPTLGDVAERAGVGKAAVSAALNGSRAGTRVSESTRQRILQAAAELNYHPNASARSLRRKATGVIGFYSGHGVVNARNRFLSEVIGGLQEGCDDCRRDLLLHGKFPGRTLEDICAEIINAGKLDGIVVLAFPDDPLVGRIAASHLPAVAIADAHPALASVVADDADGMRRIARHLASTGRRRALFRACPQPRASAERRKAAFLSEAEGVGLEVVPTMPAAFPGLLTEEESALLGRPPGAGGRPDAVVCWDEAFALHALGACAEMGLRVPEDVAVTGFNGLDTAGPRAAMTTVRAPWGEVARTAVRLVAARIEGEVLPPETVLPVEFFAGDTA